MSNIELPANPVQLAELRAQERMSDSFEETEADRHAIAELEYGAEQLGFLNKTYFVDSHRAMLLPSDFSGAENFSYINFMGLSLEGKFVTYSKVHIGRLVGGTSVRAICMAFDSATLLPYFDTTPEDELLHVPVLAIKSITQTS